MAFTDPQQQNAMYKDFVAFSSVFPEVKHALTVTIAKLVRERPVDPLAFMAQKLREVNEDVKIEQALKSKAAVKIQSRGRGMMSRKKVTENKEQKEQEQAASKIQSLGRAKRDRKKVNNLRKANMVWLNDTFQKLSVEGKNVLPTRTLATLVCITHKVSDDDDKLYNLDLPDRLLRIPAQFSAMFKRIRSELEESDPDKDLSWYEFAEMFELDNAAADAAQTEAAAVRIQALGRKKRDKMKVEKVRVMRQNLEQVEGDALLGYTVNQAEVSQSIDSIAHQGVNHSDRLHRPET